MSSIPCRATVDGSGLMVGCIKGTTRSHALTPPARGGHCGIGDDWCPVKAPEGMRLTAITYCDFIRDILSDWLDELPSSDAPAHAAMTTTDLLSSMGFRGDTLMKWVT